MAEFQPSNRPRRRQVEAKAVGPGDRFMRRNGMPSEPVRAVKVVRDSFGTEAYVQATLTDRTVVTIAIGSSVRVFTERPAAPGFGDLASLPVTPGSPEEALVTAARAYPEDTALTATALRLGPRINPRAGAHLDDLVDAAERLVVIHQDRAAAAPLLAVLTDLGFDGNEGRWRATRAALALAAWLATADGDSERAEDLGARLRVGEDLAIAELRGPTAAIRRRELADPSLPERDVQRAREDNATDSELRLRRIKLDILLSQAAAGWAGWDRDELASKIEAEIAAIRELNTAGSGD